MNGLAEEQAKLKWKKLKEELQKESQLVTKVVEELNQLKKVRFLNFRSFFELLVFPFDVSVVEFVGFGELDLLVPHEL